MLGVGVAGLAAIQTAKNMGAIVRAFDVRSVTKEQVESMGATFLEVPIDEDGAGSGGYAKERSDEYKGAQEKMMLEETLIRESSTNKLQGRGFGAPTPQNKSSVGPPVTFMNPSQKSPASKDDSSAAEKTVSVGSLQDMMSGND